MYIKVELIANGCIIAGGEKPGEHTDLKIAYGGIQYVWILRKSVEAPKSAGVSGRFLALSSIFTLNFRRRGS